MAFDRQESEQHFKDCYQSTPQGLGATRSHLLRLLRSIDLVGWNSYEESGRLDRKAFTRYATGSVNVFSKREYVDAERSAVSILIDCSGSMDHDNRIEIANQVAIQLARILEKANAEFNVTGFYGNAYNEHDDATGASQGLHYQLQIPVFIPFKEWGESLAKASTKMGTIRYCANGSTPDYSSVALAIEGLAVRNEQRKVLFLLTDADGYNQQHMKQLQRVADKQNVLIVAIGIGDTDANKCFTHAENVMNINNLASASFNKLLKVVAKV
jgi:cobalamin biosynthesis protein CobT